MAVGSVSSLTVVDVDTVKKKRATKAKTTTRAKTKKNTEKKTVTKRPVKKVVKKTTPKKTGVKKTTLKKAAVKKKATASKKSATKKAEPKVKVALPPVDRLDTGKSTEGLTREPLGHLLVEKMLREAGFRGTVSTDKALLDKYQHDESIFAIRPQIVIQPQSRSDVEIAVQVVGRETKHYPSLSLTPRAAGTGLSGGSLTDSIVIDVSTHLTRIDAPITKNDMTTITVEPGAMWRDVEKILKQHDVYLPPYPASKDICSIGGSIANNAAGPDSLRYGHCADWVESIDITLYDGKTYTVAPITYKEFKELTKKDDVYGKILTEVFSILQKNEKEIQAARPHTQKNSAGYALWDVLRDTTVAGFKRGKGTLDITRLISGSQGTIGVINAITLRTESIQKDTELIVVPVFDLATAANVIQKALKFNPINVELFDGLTFDLALSNPYFFRDRLGMMEFYKVMFSMYSLYHVRYMRKVPEFTLLITVDKETLKNHPVAEIVNTLRAAGCKRARHIASETEKEMFWQIRRASYTLSKFQDKSKRPAAFLEDMTVPAENLAKFFTEIKRLLKKYNVEAAVHGHGGNCHLHFYPLLDFTKLSTPDMVVKMAEEFFNVAVKYDGNICGEHNDGIIRTPHLNKMFSKKILDLFVDVENIFDPDDIFNPGKKVNPRFDIKDSLRKTN